MTKTMRAAVVRAFGEPLAIEAVPVPVPDAGQVLVRVAACGVCHTDLHAANGDWPAKPALPLIPGHECVGIVAQLGFGVTDLTVGDRVGVTWLNSACGTCEYCLSGRESLCLCQQNTGYSVDGGFAEYVLAPAAFATPIPDRLGFFDAAPILCAGLTAYKGIRETGAWAGEWIVISGVGGTGHVAIQYAQAMGLRVAAVDVTSDKLDLARALGAEIVINASQHDPVAAIQRQIGGAHAVLSTSACASAYGQAVGMLRRGGTCVLVGMPADNLPISIADTVRNSITIRGSIAGSREDLVAALDIAQSGLVKVSIEVQPLDEINSVFARLQKGDVTGRVVISIN